MPRQYIPEPVPEPWSPELPPPPKNMWEKFSRKFKEEPLVPVGELSEPCVPQLIDSAKIDVSHETGSLATVVALVAASSALQKGNRAQFNKMLRYRVLFQGLTVVSALGKSLSKAQFSAARLLPAPLSKVIHPLITLNRLVGGSVYFGSQRRAAREAEQRAKLAAAEGSTPTPPVQV